MLARWNKWIPPFLIGAVVGVIASVAMHFLNQLAFPFTQRALNFPSNSHMKLFLQEMSAFDGGWNDSDTDHIWFSFRTRIPEASEYFRRVDASLAGTDWKLIDSHPTFRLYVGPWSGGERKEIALRIGPAPNELFFEQQRRYDGSRR